MAMTMTAVRMTARQTRMAIRKFRFMLSEARAPTNSRSQPSLNDSESWRGRGFRTQESIAE